MKRTTLTQELLAEFLGTFTLIVFGVGVVAQVVLTGKGDFLSINIAWGLAVVMGVYVAGGVSGAHLNPAVTLALAARRGFSWNKVIPFWVAQTAGAFVAAALVYLVYKESFDAIGYGVPNIDKTGTTAGVFSTYAGLAGNATVNAGHAIGLLTGLIDQIVGTMMLVMVIVAITDTRNTAPGANLAPFIIGLLVVVIGATIGANYGYAINPARDFGPRLFSFFTHGANVFNATGPNFFWVPIVGPLIGGVLGAYVYDWFIGNGLPAVSEEPGRVPEDPDVGTAVREAETA
ncbi:MAG: MIP family channel protein [Chloroflexota bacterium]|nr:MIP family channel protein [Chloroflexota bacterium]